MTTRRLKACYFGLTALNTYATTCFFNYLFFYLRDHYDFANKHNLCVSALHGLLYVAAAWQCGRFAQRRGFLTSLKVGFGGLAAVMVIGGLMNSVLGILAALVCYTIFLLFTWPALEALVSENETQAGVQHQIGVYNSTWALAAAVAFLTSGKLYDRFGHAAIFWIPAGIFLFQFLAVLWLARIAPRVQSSAVLPMEPQPHHPEDTAFHQKVSPQTFLKMAWLANPFAYVAINTVFAVMPGIAHKLALSPTRIGLFCSVWLFARFVAFASLWQWNGWHYKYRWLVTSFVMLIGSFVLLLLATQLWLVVVAQVFFGLATGLIYYSSLFYSMDVGGETQAEHGGLHEAAIGAGIFAGPAAGAASLWLFPQNSSNGVFAVAGLLLCGFAGLVWLRVRKQR